jgi:hypothetical protein
MLAVSEYALTVVLPVSCLLVLLLLRQRSRQHEPGSGLAAVPYMSAVSAGQLLQERKAVSLSGAALVNLCRLHKCYTVAACYACMRAAGSWAYLQSLLALLQSHFSVAFLYVELHLPRICRPYQ